MKKTIIYLFLILVLCSFCYAAPPLSTVQTSTQGLTIESSGLLELDINNPVTFHFHIFDNNNSKYLDNTTTNCYLHTYNQSSHIEQLNLSFENTFDFEAPLNTSLYRENMTYSFIVQCNTSTYGGFLAHRFSFVSNQYLAEEFSIDTFEDSTTVISIILFLLLMNGMLFYLYYKLKLKNELTTFISKRACLILGIFFLMFNFAILSNLAVQAGLNITKELFLYMQILGWVGYVALIILCFSTIIQFLGQLKRKKRGERIGEQ